MLVEAPSDGDPGLVGVSGGGGDAHLDRFGQGVRGAGA